MFALSMPGEVEHSNGAQRVEGIALTGTVAFDQELYGGDDRVGYVGSIGVADDDQQDERERALARFARAINLLCAVARAAGPPVVHRLQETLPRAPGLAVWRDAVVCRAHQFVVWALGACSLPTYEGKCEGCSPAAWAGRAASCSRSPHPSPSWATCLLKTRLKRCDTAYVV